MNLNELKKTSGFHNFLNDLTEEELLHLNSIIIDRVKLIRKSKAITEIASFFVGDRVAFRHKNQIITGVIKKLNSKSVTVQTGNDESWNIAPSLLVKET